MAAIVHHGIHHPFAMNRMVHGVEKIVSAVLFTLLPPIAFALLILSGLLLALTLSKLM